MVARGLIIGAPRSGSGKTTLTLAILAALRRRGVAVRAAKSGPDYIDPAFHAAAVGAASPNLDSWAMPPGLLDAIAAEAASGADLLLIESAMGLFDGLPGLPGRGGAAADIAARYGLSVLLVLDISGQSQTAAAVARGFAFHDPAVSIGGVILNRAGSPRHAATCREAIEAAGLTVLGAVPREAALTLPERHLGLVQAREHGDLPKLLDSLADLAERHLDLDRIVDLARPLDLPAGQGMTALPPPGNRIALAADAAFTFIYPHVLDGWRRSGAEIVTFSPLADEAPPEDCDCCWLPGGYPELHGGTLAAATRFKRGLAEFAATRPVHGECGGYMVLGAGLVDAAGARHEMAGLLGHATSFAKRRLHLGYRQATLLADSVLGPAGSQVRGHEFHYATVSEESNDAPLAALADGRGESLGMAGGRRGQVSGSFFHAIARWDSPPAAA